MGLPTAPSWTRAALDVRVAAFAALITVGVISAFAPKPVFAALALPLLLALAIGLPEIVLVLFLTAGLYKQHPIVASLFPLDVTVCVAAVLLLTLLIRFLRRPAQMPHTMWLLAPLVLMMLVGIVSPANAYGFEKATRFVALTGLAIVSAILLLDRRKQMERFLVGLGILSVVVSVTAVGARETNEMGRLTLSGSSSIALGRVGALAFAFGWLRFHFKKSSFDRAVSASLVVISAICILNSGSRGPAAACLLSMVAVSIVTALQHRKSPIGIAPLVTVVVVATLLVSVLSLPYIPLYRFQLLFSEHKGASVIVRGVLFATAWKLTLAHPLGLGVGGFERHALLDLRYPHNLFLEVGSELGWIPLLSITALIMWSLVTTVRVLKQEYSWPVLFLAVSLATMLANSMVSGDLNDNRILFALLPLPFVWARMQRAADSRSRTEPVAEVRHT